ncbi:MAG: ParA family protein [Spirochaetia bacterium]|jgi:chromosome partitioning protein|nr:ParA family protein [Spirochaetia bacterium]
MGKTIVFANQKGGVGKTTTAVNLGAYIADAGKKILLVDFDPQGNLSSSLGLDKKKPGIYEVLSGKAEITDVIQKTPVENLYAVAANINLTGANIELVDQDGKEYYLKKTIEKIKNNYDYIFIDSPPSLGILTLNGLVAADSVIIPLQCEYFALEGLTLLVQTIAGIQRELNKKLSIGGIVFTMYDSRTNLANEVVKNVTGYFREKVFRTVIPRNVSLSEAPSHGLPISMYRDDSTGAKSYKKLSEEVITRV